MNRIQDIVDQFTSALSREVRPQIEDFLYGVEEQQRAGLFAQLLKIELRAGSPDRANSSRYLERFPEFENEIQEALQSEALGCEADSAGDLGADIATLPTSFELSNAVPASGSETDTGRIEHAGEQTLAGDPVGGPLGGESKGNGLAVGDAPTLPPSGLPSNASVPDGELPTMPPGQQADQASDLDSATIPPSTDPATIPPKKPASSVQLDTVTQLGGPRKSVRMQSAGQGVMTLGDYDILAEIARGGMGVVYKARQRSLNRIVALKMILSGQFAGEEDVQRFYAEAEAAANLDHPGIVPIFDVGEVEGQHYFSMGFIDGQSLSDMVEEGPLPAREAARITLAVSQAIGFAHDHGVIHRDLKPANVLLDSSGQPKVTDFGLAKKLKEDSGLTATGQVLGTPNYMPPEQASGKLEEVTETSDVYSLGAILYCLLTGRPPFQAATAMDTLLQVLESNPPNPSALNRQTPRDLETIALKCLDKDVKRRYSSAHELCAELERYMNGEPIQARPISTPERVWRWCRRKPALASLFATIGITLLSIAVIAPLVAWNQASLRHEAEDARQEIAKQRDAAEHELYARTVSLAFQRWKNNNVNQAEQMLNSTPNKFRSWEWRYLKQLCHNEMFTLRGHRDVVHMVRYSPDGENLITLGASGTVFVWDPETGMRRHSQTNAAIGISRAGDRLAVNERGRIRIVDTFTSQTLLELPGHSTMTQFATFSADDKQLITSGSDKTIRVWDLTTGQRVLQINDANQYANCSVAISPNGKLLAWKTQIGFVAIHDVETGEQLHRWREDRGGTVNLINVDFSPDSSLLATCGYDGRVRIYDAKNAELQASLVGHKGFVYAVRFDPTGERLVSSAWDNTIRIWDVEEERQILSFPGHGVGATYGVFDADFDPDGKQVVSGGADGTVKIWDVHSAHAHHEQSQYPGEEPEISEEWRSLLTHRDPSPEFDTISRHVSAIESVSFSPDSTRIVTGSWDKTVKVHDLKTGKLVTVFLEHDAMVGPAVFSHDGSLVASGTGGQLMAQGGAVFVWEPDTAEIKHKFVWGKSEPPVSRLAFVPGDRYLIAAGGSQLNASKGAIKIYDLQTGELAHSLGSQSAIRSLGVHPDGKSFATGGYQVGITLRSVETGEEIITLDTKNTGAFTLSIDASGDFLAAGCTDSKVRLWDLRTNQLVWEAAGHNGAPFGICFSPDGKRVCTASPDATIRLWDRDSGNELLVLRGHDHEVYGVQFSPNGKLLASSSYDGTVNIRGDMSFLESDGASENYNSDDWVEIFADDFNRQTVGEEWLQVNGDWEIEDGALKGSFQPMQIRPSYKFALAIPKDLRMPSHVEIEMEMWTPARQIFEVKCADIASELTRSNLVSMFMTTATPSYNDNTKGTLINVCNSGRYLSVQANSSVWMEPDTKYHVLILRNGARMQVFVDGEEVVAAKVPSLNAPFLHVQGGFGEVGDLVYFDNLKVRAPKSSLDESDALRLVDQLIEKTFDVDLATAELQELVESQEVSNEVAELAREMLSRRSMSPIDLNQAAWPVVLNPDQPLEAYKRAVRQARAAVRMLPDHAELLNTLAVAEYRAEQYEAALETITHAIDIDIEAGKARPVNMLVAAMTRHRLGDKELAERILGLTAGSLAQQSRLSPDQQQFFNEAKQVIGSEAADMRWKVVKNLSRLTQAHHGYHSKQQRFVSQAILDSEGKPLLSWRVALLPYLGEEELYEQFHLDEAWDSHHNRQLLAKMPDVFQSQAGLHDATHFQVFYGPGAVFGQAESLSISEIPDGTVDTLMVVQAADPVPWTQPVDLPFAIHRPLRAVGDQDSGVVSFAFCNGTVRTINADRFAGQGKTFVTADARDWSRSWYGSPAWLDDLEHPFDVAKFLEDRRPLPQDPSGEFRVLLSEFGPFGEGFYAKGKHAKVSKLAERLVVAADWDTMKPDVFPVADADEILKQARPHLDKMDELQEEHPRVVFQHGLFGSAHLPYHAIAGFDRVTRLDIYAACLNDDMDRAILAIRRALRLSRDLRIRTTVAGQSVARVIDFGVIRMIASHVWHRSNAEKCQELIELVSEHNFATEVSAVEGGKMEYIQWQEAIWRLAERHMPISHFAIGTGVEAIRVLEAHQLDFAREAKAASEIWRRYLQVAQLSTHEMLGDQRMIDFSNRVRELGELAKQDETGRWLGPVMVARATPDHNVGLRSYLSLRVRFSGILGGLAVRAYALKHNQELPADLNEACGEAGIEVPIDPYDGFPMKFVVYDDMPRIYSVGRDGQDLGGKLKWADEAAPGYTIPVDQP